MHVWFKAKAYTYNHETDDEVKLDSKRHYFIYEDHPNAVHDYYGFQYLLNNTKDFDKASLSKLIKTGLAKYIHEDENLFNKVFAIDYQIYRGNCIFSCVVDDDFKAEDIKELQDYINGQISDGWGENGIYVLDNEGWDFQHIWVKDNAKRVYKGSLLITPDNNDHDYDYFDTWEKAEEAFEKSRVKFLNYLKKNNPERYKELMVKE